LIHTIAKFIEIVTLWHIFLKCILMYFLLGLLSCLMIAWIPGAIILRLIQGQNRDLSRLGFFLLAFAMSWIFNFLLVMLLVLLHAYTTPILRGVAIIEVGLFIWIFRKDLSKHMYPFGAVYDGYQKLRHSNTPVLSTLTALILLILFSNWAFSLGDVFGYWDPTVSYNHWAVEFAQNHLPGLTWHYPQLLPANWSISYVLLGSLPKGVYLEMFPAALQGWFLLSILLLCLFAFQQTREVAFKWVFVVLALLLSLQYWIAFNTGYADFAVTCFNFFAIMLVILKPRHWRLLSLIMAFAAAMTKPSGIYSIIAIPLFQMLYPELKSQTKPYLRLILTWLILFALTSVWYVYSSLYGTPLSTTSLHFGDIQFLMHGIYVEQDYLYRLAMIFKFGYISMFAIIISLLLRKHLPSWLKILFYLYLPYFAVWAVGFSYDSRNLVFLWPVLGLCLGFILGEKKVQRWIHQEIITLTQYRAPAFLCIIAGILAVLLLAQPNTLQVQGLVQHQINRKNEALPLQDQIILRYLIKQPDFKGMILSVNPYFQYIPMLKDVLLPITPQDYQSNNMLPNFFSSPEILTTLLAKNPQIHYLILQNSEKQIVESPAVQALLSKWIKTGKLHLIMKDSFMGIYQIKGVLPTS